MSISRNRSVPDVSVVMPVFNKLELTRVCLESIHDVGAEASFEVIVVDNGSSDGSLEWLRGQEKQGRLRLVVNPDNLGFARGCNLGAAAARGRYILFLNNDMQVLEDWLDPLVSTLDRDPEAGIAGAKLLFPDNTIQHAGVALVDFQLPEGSHLSGVHLSYKLPAHASGSTQPQYNQIVTGACLLVRRELFQELEGFDEGFWNGNEDVDFCLRAGRLGWRTVYRPESVIYHFESQSGSQRWTRTRQNIERLDRLWRGKAKPDYTTRDKETFEPTADLAIRSYVSPRLALPGPGQRPGEGPVVSVVVLTWNALDYTRKCAASLLEHTDPRHELIFVDNGSRRETIDFLEELSAGHSRVKVILNGRNLGFAAGNNVGIAASGGDYVCLLNSDTVVTEGWLDALLAPAEKDPRVGLVGPVTNSISGAQKLPSVPYDQDTLAGLAEFAARNRSEQAGRTAAALMTVGFCMLIRKTLIERIGGLDEGFGQGNYEDTDYCLRTALAGCKVDYAAQIEEKFAVFRRKWNLAEGARSTASLDLEQLLKLGFVAPLYFHPLPQAEGVTVYPLERWEKERWIRLGEAFFEKGRLPDAERVFRAVLALQPDSLRAANNLACALWGQKDQDKQVEALAVLNQVLEKDPANEDARWNLAEMQTVGS